MGVNCYFNPCVFVFKIIDLGIALLEERLTMNVAIYISINTLTMDSKTGKQSFRISVIKTSGHSHDELVIHMSKYDLYM